MKIKFWIKKQVKQSRKPDVAMIAKDSRYLTTKDLVRILDKKYRKTD